MAEPEFVTLQVEDGVGTIRLDRPKMNAINEQLHREVRAAAMEADRAGRRPRRRPLRRRAGLRRRRRHQGDVPARRHGHGRLGPRADRTPSPRSPGSPSRSSPRSPATRSAAATSWRCARTSGCWAPRRRSASRRSCSASSPGAGGTQRLARLVGPAKAKDLIFTGRHVGAEEALEIGLADAVVPDDEVYATAVAMARKFAAGPPLALAAAKQAIDEGLELPIDAGPGAGEPAVRRAVRHRGPEDRHALLPRERPGQGDLHRPLRPPSQSVHHTFVRLDRPLDGRASATIAAPPGSGHRGPCAARHHYQEDTCDEAPCEPRSRS